MKRICDCWRCGEGQDMDENPLRCPNCEAPNPCGHPLDSTVAERQPPKLIVESNPRPTPGARGE